MTGGDTSHYTKSEVLRESSNYTKSQAVQKYRQYAKSKAIGMSSHYANSESTIKSNIDVSSINVASPFWVLPKIS